MAIDPRVRLAIRLPADTYDRTKYWASKEGISANEWITEAIEWRIAQMNQDYPLPTLEQARLNQILDVMQSQTLTVNNLERLVVSLGETIIGLARGDNFLLDEEDGELSE